MLPMQNIKSILVPVDFSAIAANAYNYALQLADRLGASIDLLYSIPPASAIPDQAPFAVSFVEDLQQEAEAGIQQFMSNGLNTLAEKLKGVPVVRCFVKVGDLRYTINDLVADEQNDLIVMGTHGQQDALDKAFGTNTTFLLKKAPRPVLVVPDGCAFRPLNLLCYATDLNQADSLSVEGFLGALDAFNPKLHFLHVMPEGGDEKNYNLGRLREVFKDTVLSTPITFATVRHAHIVEGVFLYAETHECDLIIMHRPEHSWLADLFRSSNTREAVLRATRPLLVLRSEDLVPLSDAARSRTIVT